MKWQEKIVWNESIKPIIKNNKVLIGNTISGKSLFISLECYNIINEAISDNYTFCQLVEAIEDNKSREYMKNLVQKLEIVDAWKYEQDGKLVDKLDISFDITNCCNLKCRHCCLSAGDFLQGEDLQTNQLLRIMDQILDLKPKLFTISGGEPLMRKDFRILVNHIRERYAGKLILMTNGTLIDEDLAKYIVSRFNQVDVSIDGADEESCSKLRGQGTFAKCMNGIKMLQLAGMEHITASMVETKDNLSAKASFMEMCKNQNIQPFIRELDDTGRASDIFNECNIEHTGEKCSRKEIEKRFIQRKMYLCPPQIFNCPGAKYEFQIDYRGYIFPCGALMQPEFRMGNVLEIENLKQYIESGAYKLTSGYKLFESYHPSKIARCKDCEYNVLCFSCISSIRRNVLRQTLYSDCEENGFFYELYWRNYESS